MNASAGNTSVRYGRWRADHQAETNSTGAGLTRGPLGGGRFEAVGRRGRQREDGVGARRRRHRDVGFWLWFAVIVLYPVTMLLFKVRWRGQRHLPASGGVLVVANHVSYADPITFARFIWDSGRVFRFLAKDSLFTKKPLVGRIVRSARQIPVRRGTVDAGDSLRAAVAALNAGECVCIYAEGTVTRDPDWWPMLGKTGVARLALSVDLPVVPVAQWGPQFAVDVYHK